MRLFLAFDLGDELKAQLEAVRRQLRAARLAGKWTAPTGWHATALFLGEQPTPGLVAILAATRQVCAAFPAFALSFAGYATFGRPPRVLVAALASPEPGFAELAKRLQAALIETGVSLPPGVVEQAPQAHLTLARFRQPGDSESLRRVGRRREDGQWEFPELPLPDLSSATVEAERLVLYESHLTPAGPRYRALDTFALAGQNGAS